MELELKGRRALVTGSSSGIGAACARMLAVEGCEVMVHGRNTAGAEAVAAEIRLAGGLAHVAIGDLSTAEGAGAVIAALDEFWSGEADILVSNAGGASAPPVPWEETPDAVWIATYQMNVMAVVRLIRKLLPGMKARGWGRLIQIGSASAIQPIAMLPDYAAAKAATTNMAVSLARALAGTGVTANTVTPGRILTPAVERAFAGRGSNAAWSKDQGEGGDTVPMGKPDDIAFVVTMLCSPRSAFITGANLRVDGGQVKSIN